jgi:hypothetical protein
MGLELVESSNLHGSLGPSALTLQRECIKPDAFSQYRSACLHAASLLWNAPQNSLMERARALTVSEKLNALGDADWAQRVAELKAISPDMQMALVQAEYEPEEWRKAGCDKLQVRRQRLLDITEGGSWKAAKTLLAKGAAR